MQVDIEDIRDTYGCDKQTAKEIRKMVKDLKAAKNHEHDIEPWEVPY